MSAHGLNEITMRVSWISNGVRGKSKINAEDRLHGFRAKPSGCTVLYTQEGWGLTETKGHEIVMKQCDGDDDDRAAEREKLSLPYSLRLGTG